MPLKTWDATVADFEQSLEKFVSENNSPDCLKFILFLADKDPATGKSWCPGIVCFLLLLVCETFSYCNVAEPIIYEKLGASKTNVVLLRAYAGDKPTWRNPSHPWRVDPKFQLMGVPTLVRWEKEAVVGRLEDYEAHEGSKIDALLASN